MSAIAEVSTVRKAFPGPAGDDERIAVADLSFTVDMGEVVCVVGKSGCGKSTLVNMLLGLEQPSRGSIRIGGCSPTDDFMGLRRKIAAVFQTDRLLPWRTVVDNAALGLEAVGVKRTDRVAAAMPWLERVGLAAWANHFPHQLSGGMRQRVAICRAFVLDPDLVLMDEAFGHLDEVTAQQLRNDCLELIRETGKAALVVTHNIVEALEIGTRVLVLGRPARVLAEFSLSGREATAWPEQRARLRAEIYDLIETRSED
ncbi:MAG: ABC transporter ATP-binding protein [Lautropia sp.]